MEKEKILSEALIKSGYYCIDNIDEIKSGLPSADCFKLAYQLRGKCSITINEKVFPLERRDYVFLRENDVYSFGDYSTDSKIFFVYLSREEMQKFFSFFGDDVEKFFLSSTNEIIVSGDINVGQKIVEIYDRITQYGINDITLVKLFVLEVLTGIVRFSHRKVKKDETPHYIVDAIQAMQNLENLREGVPAFERCAGYSRSQLCRILKKYYRSSPQDMIKEFRLGYAYNLIKFSDLSYESIAEKIGFKSVSHFYHVFNQKYHMTPAEFRKKFGNF